MEMKSRKILIVSFCTVTTFLFGGCRAQNDDGINNIDVIDQKQCICDWNAGTPTVPDILFQSKNATELHNYYYRRQIIFLYEDLLNNDIKIYIPSRQNQKLIPDPPIQNNDELITLTNETVNDLFFNYSDHVTLEYAVPRPVTIEIDKIINEESWPASLMSILQLNSEKTPPDHSVEQEPSLPIKFSEGFWPDSRVSNIKSVYYGEQGPGQSVQVPMTNFYKPGNSVIMINSGYSQFQRPRKNYEIQPYMIRDQYSEPRHDVIPHLHQFHQNNIKLNHSGGQKPIVPINYSKIIWPWSHMNVSHDFGEQEADLPVMIPYPYPIHLSDIKPESGEEEAEYSEYVSDSHLLHPSNIKPIDSGEQEPEYSLEVPYFHPFHPDDFEPINSGEQKPENSKEVPFSHPLHPSDIEQVGSDEQEPDHSEEVPQSHPLHPDDIEPIDSGEQKPENSKEVPHSYPIHPADIKPINYSEQKNKISDEVPHSHPLYPDDIEPIDSGEQKPENSKVVPDLLPFHQDDIEPIGSGEQKTENIKEVPDSHPLYPDDINPINSDEQKPVNSEEIPHSHPLHPDDIKPIDSGEQKPENSEEIPVSHPLHPNDIKPAGSDEQQPGHSEKVPILYPLHPDDIKPIDSGDQESEISKKVPHSHPLHPDDIKSIESGEQEPESSEEVPHLHPLYPDDIEPIDSGEKKPENTEEVSHSHPHHPADIEPIESGEQETESSEEVPHSHPLHPADIEPIESGEQETESSKKVPHSHPLYPDDIESIESDEQETESSEEVPHSHPDYPDDIEPIDSGEPKAGNSEEVPHSHPLYPSDINLVRPGDQETNHFTEVVHNPSDIISVRPGKEEHVQVSYPVMIQGEEPKNVFDKHRPDDIQVYQEYSNNKNPMNYHEMNTHYIIQNQIPGKIQWSLKWPFTKHSHHNVHYKIPFNGLKKRKDSLVYMGYKTFDEWFREEMRIIKTNNKKINIHSVGRLILKMLNENGMFVTNGGVLKDLQGRIHFMQNLKLRPVLIGDTMSNLETGGYTNHAVSTWSEFVIFSMLHPPKTLGVIPLGTSFYPSSSPLDLFSSIFKSRNDSTLWPKIAKKRHTKRQSPNNLSPQKVDHHYTRYSSPIKITQPENSFGSKHELNQNTNTHVSEDSSVKNSNSYDESVENFLKNMPHYSLSRKLHVNRQDLSKEDHHLNNLLVESNEAPLNRKRTNVKKEHEPRDKHPHALIQNDDELIRIIGGSAATGSGTTLDNKGRSGEQHKPNNHNSHNHGSHNHKKHYHDYINWEELYHDDSLVRIIGGNAATGSGSPLSNKGRSGATN